jgi:glucosamine-6-phosphate deaminase
MWPHASSLSEGITLSCVSEEMVRIFQTKDEMASAAANHAADSLQRLLKQQDTVRLLAATGASQLEFLERLTSNASINWRGVEIFHLDEYVGIGSEHPASFARYIKDRIIDRTGIERYHLLDGARDAHQVAEEMGREINTAPVDLAFAGIGENGHFGVQRSASRFRGTEGVPGSRSR